MNVARNLKANRTSGGALQLEGVEVQIQLDDTKKIEDLVPKQVHKKDFALNIALSGFQECVMVCLVLFSR